MDAIFCRVAFFEASKQQLCVQTDALLGRRVHSLFTNASNLI